VAHGGPNYLTLTRRQIGSTLPLVFADLRHRRRMPRKQHRAFQFGACRKSGTIPHRSSEVTVRAGGGLLCSPPPVAPSRMIAKITKRWDRLHSAVSRPARNVSGRRLDRTGTPQRGRPEIKPRRNARTSRYSSGDPASGVGDWPSSRARSGSDLDQTREAHPPRGRRPQLSLPSGEHWTRQPPRLIAPMRSDEVGCWIALRIEGQRTRRIRAWHAHATLLDACPIKMDLTDPSLGAVAARFGGHD